MVKKKAQRLENSIVLSIQYSRLLEEIDDTQGKIEIIKGKKFELSKTKKIEHNENYIKSVNEAISEIKKHFPEERYNFYVEKKLEEKINLLSSQKNFETIKYNIAIRTVLDNVVDYVNTDDYLEVISAMLFNDKNKIREIKKELYKIYGILTNTKSQIPNDSGMQGLVGEIVPAVGDALPAAKPLLPRLKSAAKVVIAGIKKHPKVAISLAAIGAAVGVGGGLITGLRKRRKTVKAFKHIETEDLEYILLVNALCLKVASEYMDEIEYYKYFQNKLRVINSFKKKIDKELFVKWYDKENNSEKIMLLNRFDEYLIKHIKFIQK